MLGKKVVFCEHSLYGFCLFYEVSLNKALRIFFTDVDETISALNIANIGKI